MKPCCLSSISPHLTQNTLIFSIMTPVHIFLSTSNNIRGLRSCRVGSITFGIGASRQSPHPSGISFLMYFPFNSSYTLSFTLSSHFCTMKYVSPDIPPVECGFILVMYSLNSSNVGIYSPSFSASFLPSSSNSFF